MSAEKASKPKAKPGGFLKYASLFVLVLQTTACVLVLRYSRRYSDKKSGNYISSTAIFLAELCKLVTCLLILFFQQDSFKEFYLLIMNEIFRKPRETFKLIVPAGLYTIQNNLLFLALTNLDAATYQVTYQLKILTTALFSVAMLHKKLTMNQWFSLVCLMIGVTLVQWPQDHHSTEHHTAEHHSTDHNATETANTPKGNSLIGLIAVILSCFSSGFSGVYFEKLIKFSNQSLWVRNVQMCLFAGMLSALTVLVQDYNAVSSGGFFQGYNEITVCVIALHAFGGLVVAFVMKHADNILKGFATSISIVLSTLFSYYLLNDFEPTKSYFFGSTIVILATILYSV